MRCGHSVLGNLKDAELLSVRLGAAIPVRCTGADIAHPCGRRPRDSAGSLSSGPFDEHPRDLAPIAYCSNMRLAMLPGDEVAAIGELTTNWSLVLLKSDVLVGGKPVFVADPLAVIPAELPTESSGPPEFLFWRSVWGQHAATRQTPAGRVAETYAPSAWIST